MMRAVVENVVDGVADALSSASVRQYCVCLAHLILCVALIAQLTPGDEPLVLGGLIIPKNIEFAFGAFNCVSLVVIILAAIGNLYLLEAHLTLYYYFLLASIIVDIGLLAMFAVLGASCNRVARFSQQTDCTMLGGSVSVMLLLLILFKVLSMMTAAAVRRGIRNKNSEDLLPLLKESLEASLASNMTQDNFKPCNPPMRVVEKVQETPPMPVRTATVLSSTTMGAPQTSVMTSSAPRPVFTSMGGGAKLLDRSRIVSSQEAPYLASYGTTATLDSYAKARPLSPDYVQSAPPQVIAAAPVTSFAPSSPIGQIPAVSMPLLSKPIPSSLAHIGPADGQRPLLEVSTERLLEPEEPEALCPALILSRGESEVHFTITLASIQRLSFGDYPVEILGPSGRPLLHARLPPTPSVGRSEGLMPGLWLELCTTPTSSYPHGSIGPMFPGVLAEDPLEIRGPTGQVFATLQPGPTGWFVERRGRSLLSLDMDPSTGSFRSVDEEGERVLALASPASEEALQVQMDAGVDALLNLVCLLSAILMSFGQQS